MGSTGAFLQGGGFKEQGWEQVGSMLGVKVIKKIIKNNEQQSLPPYSNTPGTAYLLLNPDGSFKQFRQYGEDRAIDFDIDYGKHGGKLTLHVHWKREKGREPEIIVNEKGEVLNQKLYNKYKKFFKGVNL